MRLTYVRVLTGQRDKAEAATVAPLILISPTSTACLEVVGFGNSPL